MSTLVVIVVVTVLVLGSARLLLNRAKPPNDIRRLADAEPASPLTDSVTPSPRRGTVTRALDPPDGAGPDLVIEYVDADSAPSTRRISLLSVVQARAGLLVDFDRIESWCHKARDLRTFRADRVRSAQRPDAAAPTTCRLALADAVRERPGLLRRAGPRAQLVWTDPAGALRIATIPRNALVTSVGERRAEEVTIREVTMTPDGLVLGFRAKRASTKRVAAFWLRGIRHLADAETGEVVDDAVQAWLMAATIKPQP